jgi:hypothetical protein
VSCVPSKVSVKNGEPATLPPIPARIEQCLAKLTEIPVKDMDGEELVRLLAKVRTSEVNKTRCGRDLKTWYEGVRSDFGPKPKPKFLGMFKR